MCRGEQSEPPRSYPPTNPERLRGIVHSQHAHERRIHSALLQRGHEGVMDVIVVSHLAAATLADPIPAVVVREQQAVGVLLDHRTDQLEMLLQWLPADGVERNPGAEIRDS